MVQHLPPKTPAHHPVSFVISTTWWSPRKEENYSKMHFSYYYSILFFFYSCNWALPIVISFSLSKKDSFFLSSHFNLFRSNIITHPWPKLFPVYHPVCRALSLSLLRHDIIISDRSKMDIFVTTSFGARDDKRWMCSLTKMSDHSTNKRGLDTFFQWRNTMRNILN